MPLLYIYKKVLTYISGP